MALQKWLPALIIHDPFVAALVTLIALILGNILYSIFLHPIAHIPGPLLPKITSLWLYYHAYIGDEPSIIHYLHKRYGPLLRVAPNHVDISDADAIQAIYVTGGGFPKAACYANFDIDGHQTIFSTIDPAYRTLRAKAVVPMFSTASIRNNSMALSGCVDRMVLRMQSEAASGHPVNILNLTRSLAVDVVSTHLFQLNYNGTEEKTKRLSVSAFVDAFVAVGRFFYCPNSAFIWLEWITEKLFADEHTYSSMAVVEKFVDNLVNQTSPGSQNYPGRLLELSLERTEVKAQCKDLIFAGTDSSGMNLAVLCRYLAMNPQKLERLRIELALNKASKTPAELQSLPYLTAVIKETLRLSMANPTRLPHTVPPTGWTFKSTHIPPNMIVGCSAFQLHQNPLAFPNPSSFFPERWLLGTAEGEDQQQEDLNAKERMAKNWFPFGAGLRGCIARNLALTELYMTTEKLVQSRVLEGARACQHEVEIYQWFNSCVKGGRIELCWDRQGGRRGRGT